MLSKLKASALINLNPGQLLNKNTQITVEQKKLHSNLNLFRAFLLKKGKILNNGKTQIDQFTHEGSILEQK